MQSKQSVVFIKCGGSFITDKNKPYSENTDHISLFARQFKEAYIQFPETQFIIGNGAGSYGHYAVLEHGLKEGMKEKKDIVGFAKVHDAASRLNAIFIQHLLWQNLPVFSVQPSAFLRTSDGIVRKTSIQQIIELLQAGMIPSVYGDIVPDSQRGCHVLSTEAVFDVLIQSLLSQSYRIKQIIHLTSVPGVLDENGSVVPEITQKNKDDVFRSVTHTKGFDVTGGMRHKVEEAFRLAQEGIISYIGTITDANTLKRIITRTNTSGTILH